MSKLQKYYMAGHPAEAEMIADKDGDYIKVSELRELLNQYSIPAHETKLLKEGRRLMIIDLLSALDGKEGE